MCRIRDSSTFAAGQRSEIGRYEVPMEVSFPGFSIGMIPKPGKDTSVRSGGFLWLNPIAIYVVICSRAEVVAVTLMCVLLFVLYVCILKV